MWTQPIPATMSEKMIKPNTTIKVNEILFNFFKTYSTSILSGISDTISAYLILLSSLPVDFDKITLFEGFDYCQADTDIHNRFERSLPIMMLSDTFWLRFFQKSLSN